MNDKDYDCECDDQCGTFAAEIARSALRLKMLDVPDGVVCEDELSSED